MELRSYCTRIDKTLALLLDIRLGSYCIFEVCDCLGRVNGDRELELRRALDSADRQSQKVEEGRGRWSRGVATYMVMSEDDADESASAIVNSCNQTSRGGGKGDESIVDG